MSELAIVLSTFASREEAANIVRTLVEERLAACGNMVPGLESIYRWNGGIEQASEVIVLLKCPAAGSAKLRERLLALHPYEVPECVVLRSSDVSPGYLNWLIDSCGP